MSVDILITMIVVTIIPIIMDIAAVTITHIRMHINTIIAVVTSTRMSTNIVKIVVTSRVTISRKSIRIKPRSNTASGC